MKTTRNGRRTPALPKTLTGIAGLDEITDGGLPRCRPTLVCGGAGCGKTLLGMEFLLRGAGQFNEPGVFMAFEENAEDLAVNVASLGFNVRRLVKQRRLLIDHVQVDGDQIEAAGEYDLSGLFIRLDHAIDRIGARRVVIDTVERLFSHLPNPAVIRSELQRLFRWLKDKEITTLITSEQGEGRLTRWGLEEYVSDCVLLLDHEVTDHVSTRRLRVVKYRGTAHGTNEYPFLIDQHGISVLPVTGLGLDHPVSGRRVSTGIRGLDAMLGGRGFFRGSSVLVSGTAGAGKTSVAGHMADAACQRGERCLYFSFEESPRQIGRNLRSIGLKLDRWVRSGCLHFQSARPTLYGLEMHLVTMLARVKEFRPDIVILDPITAFTTAGQPAEVPLMLARLIDALKQKQITALFTSLTSGGEHPETTDSQISSLTDTWLLLRELEQDDGRTRGLYILKSRGMAHSHRVHAFQLTRQGLVVQDALPARPATAGNPRIPRT
jgi:circadian clock protein KaiC